MLPACVSSAGSCPFSLWGIFRAQLHLVSAQHPAVVLIRRQPPHAWKQLPAASPEGMEWPLLAPSSGRRRNSEWSRRGRRGGPGGSLHAPSPFSRSICGSQLLFLTVTMRRVCNESSQLGRRRTFYVLGVWRKSWHMDKGRLGPSNAAPSGPACRLCPLAFFPCFLLAVPRGPFKGLGGGSLHEAATFP